MAVSLETKPVDVQANGGNRATSCPYCGGRGEVLTKAGISIPCKCSASLSVGVNGVNGGTVAAPSLPSFLTKSGV